MWDINGQSESSFPKLNSKRQISVGFFTDGEYVAFAASGGGTLPDSIAASVVNNQILVDYFETVVPSSDKMINPDLRKIVGVVDNWYLSSFTKMSSLGLFAFDRTSPGNISDTVYHRLTTPQKPLFINSLPDKIKEILLLSLIDAEMPMVLDMRRVE